MIDQGFIIIMLRELNNNRYIVERANYDELPDDIHLSDDEGDADDFLQGGSLGEATYMV